MQTFLPYASYSDSAKCLDNKRLGKQRVEGLQILELLKTNKKTGAWANHPVCDMWRGYEQALIEYICVICDRWTSLGYKDTCKEKALKFKDDTNIIYPWWLGIDEIHRSHRSNLYRKNSDAYNIFTSDGPDLPYCWPKDINGTKWLRYKYSGLPGYENVLLDKIKNLV